MFIWPTPLDALAAPAGYWNAAPRLQAPGLLRDRLEDGEMSEIKTHYQFLHFQRMVDKPMTLQFHCFTHSSDELGIVKWYSPWRQYCYFPLEQAVYSAGCLTDISDFCRQLDAIQKSDRQGEAK
jgi:hypothetical protein